MGPARSRLVAREPRVPACCSSLPPASLRPPPLARSLTLAPELKHAAAASGDVVKVLYTARHGEAEHNVLAEKYNEPDDDGVSPPSCASSHPQVQVKYPITDPNLTTIGVAQARRLGAIFEREAAAGMPLPSRFFVSPLRRPGETCGLEWGWRFKKAVVEGDMGHGVPGEVVEVSGAVTVSDNAALTRCSTLATPRTPPRTRMRQTPTPTRAVPPLPHLHLPTLHARRGQRVAAWFGERTGDGGRDGRAGGGGARDCF